MDPVFQLRSGWLAASVVAILFEILFPLALAFFVRMRFGIPWRYFLYGALIFFLFQIISRVPAVFIIQTLVQKQLQASTTFQFIWLLILSFTAGLFEEVGRYIGYRWLMKRDDKTWSKALMYGLGHGGLESILLVGGLSLITLVNLVVLSTMSIQALPEQQRTLVTQQLAQLSALPDWTPLLGAYERLWAIAIQVALSVIVLQGFRRGGLSWLWLAILAHTVVDFVTSGLSAFIALPGMLKLLLPEAVVTIFGLFALWIIWRLRDIPPTGVASAPAAMAEEAVPPLDS